MKMCVHNFCVSRLKNSIQPIFICEKTFLALLDVDLKDVFPQLALAKTFELKPTSCAQNLEFVPHNNLRLVNSYVYNLWRKPWTQHVKNTPCPCKLEGCVFTTCTTQNPWTQPTSCAQNLEFVHNLRLVDSYVYNLWWKPWTQHMKKDRIIHRWLHNFWPKPWTQPHNSHSWIIYPLANYAMVLLMTLVATLFYWRSMTPLLYNLFMKQGDFPKLHYKC